MQELGYLKESASQTAGPYVHIGCMPSYVGLDGVYPENLGRTMLGEGVKGQQITIEGQVVDGTGTPLKDAMVEIWQADAAGLYNSPSERRGQADPAFSGWGRQATDADSGLFTFETIKPGAVPWTDGRMQAPHISFWIVARGINLGLNTRLYFEDEAEANDADPLLARIEHRNRVKTLIAKKTDAGYRFDIHLQGPDETVFFDL
ncbi:protocatechuate 3,4-dioxygenase subunit alpha [Algicella marina]|nr:protocatechuate 3,4-dioxygenase subunit alpha [Algicella marina]